MLGVSVWGWVQRRSTDTGCESQNPRHGGLSGTTAGGREGYVHLPTVTSVDMSRAFTVDGIDHVELFVSDWTEAADWYDRVLGMRPDERFSQWRETGTGPLMLSANGSTKVALFERETAKRGQGVSPHRVAFQTDADGFLSFLDELASLELTDREGDPVSASDVVDHGLSYSIYFTDPDGNWLELTTNDYEAVTAKLP